MNEPGLDNPKIFLLLCENHIKLIDKKYELEHKLAELIQRRDEYKSKLTQSGSTSDAELDNEIKQAEDNVKYIVEKINALCFPFRFQKGSSYSPFHQPTFPTLTRNIDQTTKKYTYELTSNVRDLRGHLEHIIQLLSQTKDFTENDKFNINELEQMIDNLKSLLLPLKKNKEVCDKFEQEMKRFEQLIIPQTTALSELSHKIELKDNEVRELIKQSEADREAQILRRNN